MKHGSSALALQYVPQCLLTRSLSLRSRQHAIAIAHNRAFRPQRHQPQGHQRATATPYARTIECEWLRCSRPHHCTHRDQQVRSGQCRDHTQHACGGRGRCPRCRPAVIHSGGRHRRCEGYQTKVQSCDRHHGATRFRTIHRRERAVAVVAYHGCCTKHESLAHSLKAGQNNMERAPPRKQVARCPTISCKALLERQEKRKHGARIHYRRT